MKIITTKPYRKKLITLLKKHPELESRYYKTLELFLINPTHPSLRLHKLSEFDCYSLSINLSYRIILDLYFEKDKVILINIGSHDEVY